MTWIKTFLPEYDVLIKRYESSPSEFIRLYKKYEIFCGSAKSVNFVIDKLNKNYEEESGSKVKFT